MARLQSEDMLTTDEICRLEALKKRKDEVIERIKVCCELNKKFKNNLNFFRDLRLICRILNEKLKRSALTI